MSESIVRDSLFRRLPRRVRPLVNRFTKYAAASSVLAAVGALMLPSAPASAQEQPGAQSVEIFGGELYGDKLTDVPVSSRNPRLNDDALAGIRYNYDFTQMWGVQLSSGYSWSRASRVPIGENKLGLTTVDLDAVWNITPQFPFVAYALAGAGYAWANLDAPITGVINGRVVALSDSNGFTANAGIGVKYYVTGNLYVDALARYRYLDRLVSDSNQHMNTAETTLAIGWRF
jgi:opacity protein-like surface antigen